MENNSLLSFGCSHMYGWEHKSTENNTKPSKHVYTNILSEHYKLKHFNFAEGGASNQSIARQVIFGLDFEKENNLQSTYWIQWSNYERLEIPFLNSKNLSKNWPYVQVYAELLNTTKQKPLLNWAEAIYRNIDKFACLHLSLASIIQVNSLLRQKNKKVINTFAHTWDLNCKKSTYYIKDKNLKNMDTMYTDMISKDNSDKEMVGSLLLGKTGSDFKEYDPYTKKLWSLVDSYNWFKWGDNNMGFKPWSVQNGYGVHPEGHPTEKAHTEAFNLIKERNII